MIRLLLVDDQPIVRSGLRMICAGEPDLEVVGEASDGAAALAVVRRTAVDVAVMDLRMPGMDGTTATAHLSAHHPHVRVLVLTTFDDDEHLYRALAAGARGFLAKHAAPDELLHALRATARDEPAFSPSTLSRIVTRAAATELADAEDQALARLTARERDVLVLLPTGASNQEIASRLHLSVTTVKTHVAALAEKSGCANRVQLAVLAVRSGIAGGPRA